MWRPQWKHVRIVVGLVAGGVFTFALSPIVGQFFVVWATQHHAYDNPDKAVTGLLAWMSAVTATPWFQWGGGLAIGFACGAWLDALIGRREKRAAVMKIKRILARGFMAELDDGRIEWVIDPAFYLPDGMILEGRKSRENGTDED